MSTSLNYACDFIDDGLTAETTIEAVDGEHGELTYTYRPALPEQTAKLVDLTSSDEKYTGLAIDLLGNEKNGLLVGWTLKNRKDEVVKITRENVARVNRKLLEKIIDRVFFKSTAGAILKN